MIRIAFLLALAGAAYPQARPARPKTVPPKVQPAPKAQPAPKPQPAATAPQTFPIVSLSVEGNRTFRAEQILAMAQIKLGEEADQKRFEAARDRLVACGFFETVGYKFGPSADKTGYAASFQVQEIQQVYPIAFDRLTKPAEDMKALLRKSDPLFSDKVPGTRQILDRYAKLLEPLVGERLIGKVMPAESGELRIVFQPERMPPSIAEVRFVKNAVIPASALQNAIAGAAIGAVWEENRFRQILEASIRPLYEARGRIRVAFPKVSTEPVTDVNGFKVTVEVNEGETYTLGEVEVDAEPSQARELLRAADLKVDDIANFTEINAGVERMRSVARRKGFLLAKATSTRKLDDEKKKVHLQIHMEYGRQFVFSKLRIQGLDIISEPAIRKAWAVKEGQPFNPDYPDAFLESLRQEGVFENLGKTRSEVKTDEATGTAEVTLFFSGAPPPQKKERELP